MIYTEKIIKALEKRYNLALKNNEPVFQFEGRAILTSYCKYLLEHIKNTLKK